MRIPFLEKFTLERSLIYFLVIAVITTIIFLIFLFFAFSSKSITVLTPDGGDEWGIGGTYSITWKANGVDKVGIVLFNGTEAKWIAKNIPASQGEYKWKIYPGEKYGDGYYMAVFEYPWKSGNKIDYSNDSFAVVYSDFASCDQVSVKNESAYVASDIPNLRRVFITKNSYSGDLNGLDGADKICNDEAKEFGYSGGWQAFIGGDNNNETAVQRLKSTDKGTGGIYIEARPYATLSRGATCQRVLGKDFNSFLSIFSNLSEVNQKSLSSDFFENLANIWLGRLTDKTRKNCAEVIELGGDLKSYSYTATCQNWVSANRNIDERQAPTCYTSTGSTQSADALSGLSSGISGQYFTASQGKYCDQRQKLLCIER